MLSVDKGNDKWQFNSSSMKHSSHISLAIRLKHVHPSIISINSKMNIFPGVEVSRYCLKSYQCFVGILLLCFESRLSLVALPNSVSVLHQPPRHRPPLVPHPIQSCEAPDMWPVQVADHQDRHRAPTAGHPGSFPLQHAWLHGEENVGGLRYLLDFTVSHTGVQYWLSICE